MKKKILKITAFLTALCLIGVILFFADAFLGNPVSYFLAKNSAERILREEYSEENYVVESVSYFFESGYTVVVASPSETDCHFDMKFNSWGKFKRDTYESDILRKGNTMRRLCDEYTFAVAEYLNEDTFPYNADYCFGYVEFSSSDNKIIGVDGSIGSHLPEYPYEKLVLNKEYDLNEVGSIAGQIIVGVSAPDVSEEKAAEILLKIKTILDNADIRFNCVNLILREHVNHTENEKTLWCEGFLYSDITEENLIENVRECVKKTEDRYNGEEEQETEEYGSESHSLAE